MTRETFPTQPEEERVFLVGIQSGAMKRWEAEASLQELRRLAESTTGVIAGESLAHIRTPDPASFISSGLIQSLQAEIASSGAGTVILDEDVSPTQQNNLEKRWDVKLLTRSELILDIFARRAHTSEGKLQVELAQHQFRLPRLRGHGVALSRLGGGIGTRGPGEMKLETDRRVINKRIHTLEERLDRLKRQRATQRARRQEGALPVVALVGYTNAGKSTLLNALTGAEAFVEDKLFATLDPTTRRTRLPSGMHVVFTDTVGFINRLPTQLAAAFRATLEEVVYADVLVHVVDATSENAQHEMEVTRKVLKELGAGDTPTVLAWNKTDLLPGEGEAEVLQLRYPNAVLISALKGDGLQRLLLAVEELINQTRPTVWLKFNYKEYADVNRVQDASTVHRVAHHGDAIYVLATLPRSLFDRYSDRAVEGPPAGELEERSPSAG